MTTSDEFRARARAWLTENATPVNASDDDGHGRRDRASLADCRAFLQKLHEAGFAGITWPKEYGGQGLTTAEQMVWNELTADYDMEFLLWPFTVGLGMPGPTILALGTERQKRRYLPRLVSGEEIWCQLFSEPGTGSDVAALQTAATRSENGWVINGQKVWTSGAQHSDFGAIIARTDPTVPKHQGITMFVVDMHHPGVTVRPLKVATGTSPFNEVFFDDVEVPADAVLGEVNNGWHAAVTMLNFERITIGAGARKRSDPFAYDNLATLVIARGRHSETPVRRRLAEVYARSASLGAFAKYLHADSLAGNPIGVRGSAAKLAMIEYKLWACDIVQELFGAELAFGEDSLTNVLTTVIGTPGSAAGGGTNEIQRNLIAERILGLAKDPGVDKHLPFNQIKFSR